MTLQGVSECSISFLTPCFYLLNLKPGETVSRHSCFTKFHFV
jgi:hypothetical protein